MKRYKAFLLALVTGIGLWSCSSTAAPRTAEAGEKNQYGDKRVMVIDNPQTLTDFLIRVPGVYADGNVVSVRGGGPPLYVVDGVWLGHNYYNVASSINVNDIASVEVLKSPSELALYGREGGNGVILINTR